LVVSIHLYTPFSIIHLNVPVGLQLEESTYHLELAYVLSGCFLLLLRQPAVSIVSNNCCVTPPSLSASFVQYLSHSASGSRPNISLYTCVILYLSVEVVPVEVLSVEVLSVETVITIRQFQSELIVIVFQSGVIFA